MTVAGDLAVQGFSIRGGISEEDLMHTCIRLGTPIAEPRDGVLIKPLRPVDKHSAPLNTLSSRYGTGPFPLHTEAAYWREPPGVLLLYCVNPGEIEQTTLLVDTHGMATTSRAELQTDPWIVAAGRRPFLSSVVTVASDHRILFRFDKDCMRPAVPNSSASSIMKTVIDFANPYAHRWRAGDLLIIDNWRMLHGRSGADGIADGRLLLKILVRR
jgi:L-asparagine oxygenase